MLEVSRCSHSGAYRFAASNRFGSDGVGGGVGGGARNGGTKGETSGASNDRSPDRWEDPHWWIRLNIETALWPKIPRKG